MRRWANRFLTVLCLAVLLLVVGTLLAPSLLGLQRYVITGGSMTGTIAKGSVIYARVVPTSALETGDIITFRPPTQSALVTHRIVAVEQGSEGQALYRTKGDANRSEDPWNPVTLDGPRQARYVFHVPVLGYVLAALAIRAVRIVAIGVPAVLIAVSLLWSLWRGPRKEDARERKRKPECDGIPHDAVGRA